MLNQKENQNLTRVGPGTPAGQFLRRYWQPVGVAAELKDTPIKRIRLLGEDLVLFRGDDHGYGLVGEQCPHRGTSLAYGRVEGPNIRCPYHGWLYSREGKCVEQPAEPPESTYKNRIKHRAYPVAKLAGLLYTYMGPKPVPLLPRFDVLVRTDGQRKLLVLPQLDCNWLQPMENSVDPTHVHYLHGQGSGSPVHGDGSRPITKHEFEVFEYGIMKKRFASNGSGKLELLNAHPLVFPNMLRQHHGREHYIQYRVPVDDTHTRFFEVYFIESEDKTSSEQLDNPPVEYAAHHKDSHGVYDLSRVWMQDYMAWETAGAVFDRTKEHLATADKGIIVFRKLLKKEIEKVKKGKDPIGVIRNSKQNKMISFPTVTDTRREVWRAR